jgi:hypothetical protein
MCIRDDKNGNRAVSLVVGWHVASLSGFHRLKKRQGRPSSDVKTTKIDIDRFGKNISPNLGFRQRIIPGCTSIEFKRIALLR